MQCSRRTFLLGSASLAAGVRPGPSSADGGSPIVLEAKPGRTQLLPSGFSATGIWGYGGGVPGPALRFRQGERVEVLFKNELPQPSAIHWHGIRIDNAMDGVPDLTQDPVPPGGSFLYDFVVPDAGTFWYHTHNRTWEQLARGLYGALVVEEGRPNESVREELLVIDDWRLDEDGAIREDFGNIGDWSHAGRLGNWVTVNGTPEAKFNAERFERIRLRIVNASNARVFDLHLAGLEGWLAALDGQPIGTPEAVQSIALAPAQRADVFVDVIEAEGGEAFLVSGENGNHYAVASIEVSGTAEGGRSDPPEALPANAVARIGDLASASTAVLLMEGGAMGSLLSAVPDDGEEIGIRELVERGLVWAMNGVASRMPKKPLLAASLGDTVRINMRNETAWPHGMHLHGHHFREVGQGAPGPLRDTILVEPGKRVDIAFVADNPGDWMLHCHMVEHAWSGMNAWIRIS